MRKKYSKTKRRMEGITVTVDPNEVEIIRSNNAIQDFDFSVKLINPVKK
jgi:hypothetical protein